ARIALLNAELTHHDRLLLQRRPAVEALEDVPEWSVVVAGPAGGPVVSVGADPVDEIVAGIELLGGAVVEGRGVGTPHPADVGGALLPEDGDDVPPGGDVLLRSAGPLRLLVAVHLPEPPDEDGLPEGLRRLGPLLDQVVAVAGGDLGRGDTPAVPT